MRTYTRLLLFTLFTRGVCWAKVVNAGCAKKDLEHFDTQLGLFGGDVSMEVLWDDRGLFALQGPAAKDVVQRLVGSAVDVAKVEFGGCFNADIAGAPCFISRCGYTGEDGFELFVGGDAAEMLWDTLATEPEVKLAGLGARDTLRLEAGLCLYGQELDAVTTPVEAGLSWTIGKSRQADGAAPFLGADVILPQLRDRSTVTRMRCGILPEGAPARTGATVSTPDGVEVGVITSGAMSPILGKNISIGYVDKPYNKRGTELVVTVRGKSRPAVTTAMPFVPTSYYKLS